jgi:protein phosphatase
MPTLVLPDPSLVVLVGPAGSGKSTLAARLFAPGEIVSSDAFRAVVSGDEADQRASAVAFRILYATVERRLAARVLSVVDATNLLPSMRRPLVRRALAAGMSVAAIVLDLAADTVRAQNAGRGRVVDADVVDRHLAAVRRTVDRDQLAAEGFDPIVVLRTPFEAATLEIERRSVGPTAAATPRPPR